MSTWLLDTGPLVAYLDAADPAHAQVAARLDAFSGHLVTTSAVITEAMHLVSRSKGGPRLLAEFVTAAAMESYDFTRSADLHQAVALMEDYADTPMDFADATLVLLAEGLQVHRILTLDRRGFYTFRTSEGRALELVLDLP